MYNKIDKTFTTFSSQYGELAKQAGVTVPKNIKDAVNNKKEFETFVKWLEKIGYGKETKELTYEKSEKGL